MQPFFTSQASQGSPKSTLQVRVEGRRRAACQATVGPGKAATVAPPRSLTPACGAHRQLGLWISRHVAAASVAALFAATIRGALATLRQRRQARRGGVSAHPRSASYPIAPAPRLASNLLCHQIHLRSNGKCSGPCCLWQHTCVGDAQWWRVGAHKRTHTSTCGAASTHPFLHLSQPDALHSKHAQPKSS